MSNNTEILEKAIQKAIDGGWNGEPLANGWGFDDYRRPYVDSHGDIWQYAGDDDWNEVSAQSFIFNHDFAKVMWGENPGHFVTHSIDTDKSPFAGGTALDNYQHHLQQMVLSPDPIQYLGEYI